MAHVQIKSTSDGTTVIVDGVDITWHLAAAGFAVDFNTDDPFLSPVVTMPVMADSLEVDLPDAVVQAMRIEVGG